MKKIFLFLFLALSFSAFSQNNIKKSLVVDNDTMDFNGKLYDNSLVIDKLSTVQYLLPTGAERTDNLDSVSDKVVIGSVFTDTILLDSGDIKHLFATPVTILAAPGTGYINDVISIVTYYDYVTAPYTGDSSITVYNTGLGALGLLGNAIDGSADKMNKMSFASAPALGKNLALLLKSTTSNPVGATALGTLRVYISYRKTKIY